MQQANPNRFTHSHIYFWRRISLVVLVRATTILPIATITIVMIAAVVAQQALQSQLFSHLNLVLEHITNRHVTSWLTTGNTALEIMKADEQAFIDKFLVVEWDVAARDTLNNYLRQIADVAPNISELVFYDTHGQVIAASETTFIGHNLSDQIYFDESLIVPSYSAPLFYDTYREQLFSTITYAIRNENEELIGVIAAFMDVSALTSSLQDLIFPDTKGDLYLVTLDNQFRWSAEQNTLLPQNHVYQTQGVQAAQNAETGSQIYTSYSGNSVIGSYRYIPQLEAAIVIEFDEGAAFILNRILATIAVVTVIIILVWIVIFQFINTQMITRPIRCLIEAAEALLDGNFSVRASVDSENEIGLLTRVINHLADRLAINAAIQMDYARKLQREYRFIETILNTTETLIIVLSQNGDIVRVNKVLEKRTGYSEEQLIGQKVWDFLLVEEEIESVKKVFNELVTTGMNSVYENYFLHRNGDRHYISWSNTVLKDETGKLQYVIATGIELTEQREAKLRLQQANEQLEQQIYERTHELQKLNHLLQAVLDNTHSLIAYMDTDFNFLIVNQTYAKADEKDPHYFVGRNHFELYPHAENQEIFAKVVKTGQPYISVAKPFEYVDNPERGTTYWDWTLMPVHSETNEVIGVVLTLINVTDRIRAFESLQLSDEALRRTEMQLKTVINNAPLILFSLDRDGTFLLSEGKGLEIIGLQPGQVVGQSAFDLFSDIPDLSKNFNIALDGQEIHWLAEARDLKLQTTYTPLHDAKGNVIGVTGVSFDVTRQVRLENELRKHNETLEGRVAERTRELSGLNEQLSATLESSLDGIAVINTDGEILRINSALKNLTGSNEVQDLDDIDNQLANPLLSDFFLAEVFKGETKQKIIRFQSRIKNSNRHVDVALNAIVDTTDSRVRYLLSLRDITSLVNSLEGEKRARALAEALLDIPQVLRQSQEIEFVLNHILISLKKIITFASGNIALIENDKVYIAAHHGYSVEEVKQLNQMQVPLSHSEIFSEIVKTRRAQLVKNFSKHHDWKSPWVSSSVRSTITSPIIFDDKVQGFIAIESDSPDAFQQQQINLLVAFASQIALALETLFAFQRRTELAATRERQRLARDLHDAVSQTLFSASMIAESLPLLLERDPKETRKGLENLHNLTKSALAEMRTLLIELRPKALEETQLRVLITYLVDSIRAHINAEIEYSFEGSEVFTPIPIKSNLYRIVQEAFNNVVKHSQATRINIRIYVEQHSIIVDIVDNGIGFDYQDVQSQSMGLKIMRERAESANMQLTITSTAMKGTAIRVRWERGAGENVK